MLEPYDGKLSRTVLRGLTLLDIKKNDRMIAVEQIEKLSYYKGKYKK
jgi:hypothetical protein